MDSELLLLKEDLIKCGQKHLFTHPKGEKELPIDVQITILKELNSLSYPGGAPGYILSAQRLLGTLPSVLPELSTTKIKRKSSFAAKDKDKRIEKEEEPELEEVRTIVEIKTPPRDVMFAFPNINDPFYSDKYYNYSRFMKFPSELVELLPEPHKSEIIIGNKDGEHSSLLAIEKYGLSLVIDTILVLVADELGEELGYDGIKVSLPTETASHRCFLEHFINFLASCGRGKHQKHKHKHHQQNPFVIITSDNTHSKIVQLLADNECYGYDPSSIFILQQEAVPCLTDQDGHIAVDFVYNDQKNKEKITGTKLLRKSQGHGGVHQLLYQLHEDNAFTMEMALKNAVKRATAVESKGNKASKAPKHSLKKSGGKKESGYEQLKFESGLHSRDVKGKRMFDKWLQEEHYSSIIFIQDTNAMSLATIPFTLAAMKVGGRIREKNENDEFGLKMIFTCVNRREAEAAEVFCQQAWKPVFDKVSGGSKSDVITRIGSIDYNLFSEVYKRQKASKMEEKDSFFPATLDESDDNSLFPESVNTLLLSLDFYAQVLHLREGKIPAFINPKYNPPKGPNEKMTFKSPARIESSMQDIAIALTEKLVSSSNKKEGNEESLVTCIGCAIFSRDTFEPIKNLLDEGIGKLEHSIDILPTDLIQKMKLNNQRKWIEKITRTSYACVAATEEEIYLNFLRKRFLKASKGEISDDCCTNCFVFYEDKTKTVKETGDRSMAIVDKKNPGIAQYDKCVCVDNSVIVATPNKSGTLPVNLFPIISFDNAFAKGLSLSALVEKFGTNKSTKNMDFKITSRSVLVVIGDVKFEGYIEIDGAVVIVNQSDQKGSPVKEKKKESMERSTSFYAAAAAQSMIVVKDLNIRNKGWEVVPLDLLPEEEKKKIKKVDQIRGFKLIQHETCVIIGNNKGVTKIGEI